MIFNKYQKEEQDRLVYRNFHNLKAATTKFLENGLMSEEQKQECGNLPHKSGDVGERFGLIGLGRPV